MFGVAFIENTGAVRELGEVEGVVWCPANCDTFRRSPRFAYTALSTTAAVTKSRRPSARNPSRCGEFSAPSKPKCSSKARGRYPQERPLGSRGPWVEYRRAPQRIEGSFAEGHSADPDEFGAGDSLVLVLGDHPRSSTAAARVCRRPILPSDAVVGWCGGAGRKGHNCKADLTCLTVPVLQKSQTCSVSATLGDR
jgi:hypothetical protein